MVGFNPIVWDAQYSRSCIYIPLWSDSIDRLSEPPHATSTFTFHYGRIQSAVCFKLGLDYEDLHSIMVGFNLVDAEKR